jgi:hypothetical protein
MGKELSAIAALRRSAYASFPTRHQRGAFVRKPLSRLLLSTLIACGSAASAQPVDPALYSSMQWRLLGPFRAGWAEMIQGVPSKPNTFYFGASGGGVWKTDDAGRTWTSLFDQGGSSAVGAIAVAPSNPDVIYVGGGQPEPRYDVEAGRGIYKSTDGASGCDQVLPPSVERKIPRASLGPKKWPTAPTTTLFGLVGLTQMRPM